MEIANDSFELGVFIDHSFFSKFVEDILSCSSGEGIGIKAFSNPRALMAEIFPEEIYFLIWSETS